MSEAAKKLGKVYEFPVSKAGKIEPPPWFRGAPRAPKAVEFNAASALNLLSPAEDRLPPPPSVPSLDTPVPGSKSVPPPADGAALHALDDATRAFVDAAIDLASARAKVLILVEAQLLDLSIEIASAILDREISADPDLHLAMAREAIRSLGDPATAVLRASTVAVNAIRDVHPDATVEVDGVRVEIRTDPTIEGLGCIVENDLMRVDARIGERLRSVRRAMEDERRRRSREEGE
jgi:hypothetical protein